MADDAFFLNPDAVKRIMRLQGYGQIDLARAASKDPSEISVWVNAKRKITLLNANDLATILRCTVSQLRGFEPFTRLDLTKEMPSIGTAQRYIRAIEGKWHAHSTIHAPDGPHEFEWEVDITCEHNVLTGKTVCTTAGHEQAQYTLHFEVSGLGIVLVDGVRDAADGATDIFRGILHFHSDTKTITMNGKTIVYWPLLQQLCYCDLNMRKSSGPPC